MADPDYRLSPDQLNAFRRDGFVRGGKVIDNTDSVEGNRDAKRQMLLTTLFHDQALYKPPEQGDSAFRHQDNAYWKCQPATLVNCWLTSTTSLTVPCTSFPDPTWLPSSTPRQNKPTPSSTRAVASTGVEALVNGAKEGIVKAAELLIRYIGGIWQEISRSTTRALSSWMTIDSPWMGTETRLTGCSSLATLCPACAPRSPPPLPSARTRNLRRPTRYVSGNSLPLTSSELYRPNPSIVTHASHLFRKGGGTGAPSEGKVPSVFSVPVRRSFCVDEFCVARFP